MYKKAFTLIELIVVVSIIILLSSAGVFYFSNFIQTSEMNQDIATFEDTLSLLDNDIDKHNLLDYTLAFHVDALSYSVSKNDFFQDTPLHLDFDGGNGNVYIQPQALSAQVSGNFLLWADGLKQLDVNFTATGKTLLYSGALDESLEYMFQGSVGGVPLNDIMVLFFADKNLNKDAGDFFKLVDINEKADKTGKSYTQLEVKNISGKKFLPDNLNEVYLFFEDKGAERSMKITKK